MGGAIGLGEATEASLTELKEAIDQLGRAPLEFAASQGLADALRELFEKWLWLGGLELDLLNRVGGPEVRLLAREVVQIGKETKCSI